MGTHCTFMPSVHDLCIVGAPWQEALMQDPHAAVMVPWTSDRACKISPGMRLCRILKHHVYQHGWIDRCTPFSIKQALWSPSPKADGRPLLCCLPCPSRSWPHQHQARLPKPRGPAAAAVPPQLMDTRIGTPPQPPQPLQPAPLQRAPLLPRSSRPLTRQRQHVTRLAMCHWAHPPAPLLLWRLRPWLPAT